MRIVSVVGARPQFVKIAPVLRAFERQNEESGTEVIHNVTLHTGQHYDAEMSDVFFEELEIGPPAVNLGVGSGPHGAQTGEMLAGIEASLRRSPPDLVLVYGDTNSTLAGALAAAKLMIPVAHVESGLRSFKREMPEEINRVVADHLSDLLLVPTATAMANLQREGLAERAVFTGDVMYDAVLFTWRLAEERSRILETCSLKANDYGLVTLHRAENTDDPERLRRLLRSFNALAAVGLRLVFPLHPRTSGRIAEHAADWTPHPGLELLEPVGYLDMLRLIGGARMVLTDSGGVQKEAFFLDRPCITLRAETEWTETVDAGMNILADADEAAILAAADRWQSRRSNENVPAAARAGQAFGDGRAADKVTAALLDFHRRSTGTRQDPGVARHPATAATAQRRLR